MGWSYTSARYYKKGSIDRKAECDELFNWKSETKSVRVLKSAMVGSTYYAAIEVYENAEFNVVGVTCKTHVDGRDIGIRTEEETVGPTEAKCPNSILKILTPTEDEWANEWRKRCREYNEAQKRSKKDPYSLKNLPEGARIDFMLPFDTSAAKKGEHICLEKKICGGENMP